MSVSRLFSVDEICILQLPSHHENNGDLVVMEGQKEIPFLIARIFYVHASSGAVRGQHAHKACSQVLICTEGLVKVHCKDGISSKDYVLDRPDMGLFMPPSIWREQTYEGTSAGMIVLCDRLYEGEDYIRDYSEFLNYRMTSDK